MSGGIPWTLCCANESVRSKLHRIPDIGCICSFPIILRLVLTRQAASPASVHESRHGDWGLVLLRYFYCAIPPPAIRVEQAVMPTPRAPPTQGPESGGGLVYRTICVLRTMAEQSLASRDEAEGRRHLTLRQYTLLCCIPARKP